jgi:hypothetical protein
MEIHHVLARQHIAGLIGDSGITAFSALPGAPVQPDRPRRRAHRVLRRLVGLMGRPRRLVVLTSVRECRPVDAPGSRMAA